MGVSCVRKTHWNTQGRRCTVAHTPKEEHTTQGEQEGEENGYVHVFVGVCACVSK